MGLYLVSIKRLINRLISMWIFNKPINKTINKLIIYSGGMKYIRVRESIKLLCVMSWVESKKVSNTNMFPNPMNNSIQRK